MPKRLLHHYLPPSAVAPQDRHPELSPLASQAKELDALDYTLSVIDGNLRAACELDGELLKLNHNVMDLLNYATEVLREGLSSPNEDTRLKTAMHITSRFNLKTVHASVEKTKQVQVALRKVMVERKDQALAKLAKPQNSKTILPAALTPEQLANPPHHPSRLEDFSPLAKPLLHMLPSVIQHNVYNDKIPMPDLQTLQLHWPTWGYSVFRHEFDYRGDIHKNGKKLGALYRTTRHNETRYVLKLPLPLGEGAAPAAGEGHNSPSTTTPTTIPVGAIHESPTPAKTDPIEALAQDNNVSPEVLLHLQAYLLHLLEHTDPATLQAHLSPQHWQLAKQLLSAKQERAG